MCYLTPNVYCSSTPPGLRGSLWTLYPVGTRGYEKCKPSGLGWTSAYVCSDSTNWQFLILGFWQNGKIYSGNFNSHPTLSLRCQYMMKSFLCGNCMFSSACSFFCRCKMLKPSAIRLSVSALPAPGPFLLLQQMNPGFLISGYSGMGITGMVRLHRILMLLRVLFRWSTMCMIHSAPAAIPARRALRWILPPFAMPPFTAIMIRLIIIMEFIVPQTQVPLPPR